MDHIIQCHDIVKTDFVRGENCYLYDSQGRQFVDFESGIWSTTLGHAHPRINQVIESQMGKLMHLGTRYPSEIADKAALELLNILGIERGKCTFLSSGSEAVEFAAQSARIITDKPRLLTFTNSYLAAYGSAGGKKAEEWSVLDWSEWEPEKTGAYFDTIPFEEIGAFVFEPGGSGSGFVKFPPNELIQEISHRVKETGGLLVINEVTTGMGRTGKWFGFQHHDLEPDIAALGKGLGNGYPISAVAMTSECAEIIESNGFAYAQSHQNDPLGCSVAREVIFAMQDGNWVETGRELGAFFLEGLKILEEKYDVVKDARGRGMLLALEFDPHDMIDATWTYRKLLEQGFLVGYYSASNILRFDPSLTIEKEDIRRLLGTLDSIIESAQ